MADLVVDVDEAAIRQAALLRAADQVSRTQAGHLSGVADAVPGGRLAFAASEQSVRRQADREVLEQLLRAHAAAARGAAEVLVGLDLRLGR